MELHPEIKESQLYVLIFGTELAGQIRAAVQYLLDAEVAWVLVNHLYIFDLSHMLHYCDTNNRFYYRIWRNNVVITFGKLSFFLA